MVLTLAAWNWLCTDARSEPSRSWRLNTLTAARRPGIFGSGWRTSTSMALSRSRTSTFGTSFVGSAV
jgi:hypothetical protein